MLGNQKKNPQAFEFDLEKEIKANPEKGKTIIETAGTCMNDIKGSLREGKSDEFEQLGELMHGYAALEKVIKKVAQ